MKGTIREFIEPSSEEKQELWNKATFVFDTNVLLNLYRYSAKTRGSLLSAFESFKGRVWIPYQVAYEFMRRRCEVIYESVNRYEQFRKEIDAFSKKAIETLRLTPTDEEISELNRFLYKWLDGNKDKNLLVSTADDDEILWKILSIFDGRVGRAATREELDLIAKEGEERYKKLVPPGYKDEKKKSTDNDNNAYGDLIIWKQIINYAKENSTDIIYITHDQKEDWWNIVKGKTIGPRVELRREFSSETSHEFHMYSMNNFISTYNRLNKSPIDKKALNEIIIFAQGSKVNRKGQNSDETLTEKIARMEDTASKIQKRIARREQVIDNIEKKYQKQGLPLPDSMRQQYENTKEKIAELQDAYSNKVQEIEVLKSAANASAL